MDCLGIYDAEQAKKSEIQMFQIQGGCVFSSRFKLARAQNLDAYCRSS